MILSVIELRQYITTDETDQVLEAWLQALEVSVQRYTNNNFKRILAENNGEYPMDIKMGVVNLLKWELGNREKVGIASESISRHSVTYVDQTGDNTVMGYPVALVGFLRPYKRAQFGRGIRV